MLRKTEYSFLMAFFLSLLSIISPAQNVPKRYIIVSFDDSRSVLIDHRAIKIKDSYYWISPVDSLFSKQKIFPLFLPHSFDYSVLPDCVLGLGAIEFSNVNGRFDAKMISHYSDVDLVQQLVRFVEQNKMCVQTIMMTSRNDKSSRIIRKKEKILVHITPIYGVFQKRWIQGKGNRLTELFFPVSLQESDLPHLTEEEKRALLFYDYSGIDFSSLSIPQNVYDKGFGRITAW